MYDVLGFVSLVLVPEVYLGFVALDTILIGNDLLLMVGSACGVAMAAKLITKLFFFSFFSPPTPEFKSGDGCLV